jgi:hypothetical protein
MDFLIPPTLHGTLLPDRTSALGVVVHGSDANMARPTGYAVVVWIGTVEPTQKQTNDIWFNPQAT